MIYVIEETVTGDMKVGYSKKPTVRCAMRAHYPGALRLILEVPGTYDYETYLLRGLIGHGLHIEGEWFTGGPRFWSAWTELTPSPMEYCESEFIPRRNGKFRLPSPQPQHAVFKPAWTRDGQRQRCHHYACRFQFQGKRHTFYLHGLFRREDAQAKADEIYEFLRSNGWPKTRRKYASDYS